MLSKAQTVLILESTGKNARVPNTSSEGQRLRRLLQRCEIRFFTSNSQPLSFMDENFDLVATIKRVSHYRRGDCVDYVSDFFPPTPLELKKYLRLNKLIKFSMDPVMLSTKDSGEIVEGLSGIPSEGPVILVGNHLLVAMDVIPLFSKFWVDHNIKLRALAHPLFFERFKDGIFPELSQLDFMRVCGAVPVSPTDMYKLLSSNSHVLLYPGGVREACHNKGEEYKLFWPVEPQFVRIAARFGAKIVPFGAVGEDDVAKLLLDCNEQMKIPPLKAIIEEINSATTRLRTDAAGEVGKQILHYPIFQPKLPGRLYFLSGKPIPTQGRTDILTNRDKAREVYLEVQTEIQRCISYLKEKRQKDPYRNLLARLVYRARNGFDSQIPTFEI